MAGPEPYIDENGDERTVARLSQELLRGIGESVGEVDGIPLAIRQMSVNRLGTFTVKNDVERSWCSQREDDYEHDRCMSGFTRSDDAAMKSAIITFKHCTNGYLTEDAFDDYDEARHRPCP